MSLDSIELPHDPVLEWAAKEAAHVPVSLIPQERRALLAENIDARTDQEVDADAVKKTQRIRGLMVAEDALDFLLIQGKQPESHYADFHVGHDYQESNDNHSIQHQAYLARLALQVNKGNLKHDAVAGTYTAVQTGRAIVRLSLHHNDAGEPGVIRYIDAKHEPQPEAQTQENALDVYTANVISGA